MCDYFILLTPLVLNSKKKKKKKFCIQFCRKKSYSDKPSAQQLDQMTTNPSQLKYDSLNLNINIRYQNKCLTLLDTVCKLKHNAIQDRLLKNCAINITSQYKSKQQQESTRTDASHLTSAYFSVQVKSQVSSN